MENQKFRKGFISWGKSEELRSHDAASIAVGRAQATVPAGSSAREAGGGAAVWWEDGWRRGVLFAFFLFRKGRFVC